MIQYKYEIENHYQKLSENKMNAGKMKYETRPRRELLAFLRENADRCFSVRDIIKESGLDIGEATVYRTLSAFTEEEKVKRYHTGDGKSALYQYAECNAAENHFHLRCMKCAKLFHTDCEVIEEMVEHIQKDHGFRVDAVHTTMYGVCGDCEKKEKEQNETKERNSENDV